jgi:multidrug efflux pump subunit AcrB
VLFSLLVARLITPMLSAYFMRSHSDEDTREGWLLRGYVRLIGWSVRHRIVTVILGLFIFAGSIYSMQLLPNGFLPAEDASRILIAAELPPGSRLDDMKETSDDITKLLRARPEVMNVFVDGGRILGVAGGGEEVRKATFVVNLVNKDDREITQRALEHFFTAELAKLPDVRAWVINENGERALSLIVTGSNDKAVNETTPKIVSEMKKVPELNNVVSNSALDRPEFRFIPRQDVAADLGVSTEALSEAIRIATIGDVDANLAKFNAGDRQVPIRVQLEERARTDRQMLEALKIRTVVGTDALGRAVDNVMALPIVQNLPEGVVLKQAGDAEVMGEIFSSFGYAMGAGLMMVYSVLILLFGSFLQPLTILFSLPFSIGGAIFALLVTGQPFSFPVVIGVLMLMGIVTKNAIMLVDFAIEEIARGVKRYDAIVDAGRKRARPIVMTTIAMAGGMLPSAMAMGSGGEFRAPMAIAVIGGLLLSTLLSLIFVPAVFVLMDDVGRWMWRFFGRFVGPVDEPPGEEAAPHGAAPATDVKLKAVTAEPAPIPAARAAE